MKACGDEAQSNETFGNSEENTPTKYALLITASSNYKIHTNIQQI